MKEWGVKNIILSSSAGVYGNPVKVPIVETDVKNPLNPYGETKYQIERILEDYDTAYGIKFTSIRYFNAAGAALDGSIGEAHPEESHLIPNVIKSVLNDTEFNLFGDDYDTPDGTCIRDYIHVLDLVEAHSLALTRLLSGGESVYYNAGIGKGYSNKEVISMVEAVSGKKVTVKVLPKRQGDANALYADISKITSELSWTPKYDLREMVESAYLWHKNRPLGYTISEIDQK
jgi:UDP-glucose 4-epimerase